jgi:hypothetical protein
VATSEFPNQQQRFCSKFSYGASFSAFSSPIFTIFRGGRGERSETHLRGAYLMIDFAQYMRGPLSSEPNTSLSE